MEGNDKANLNEEGGSFGPTPEELEQNIKQEVQKKQKTKPAPPYDASAPLFQKMDKMIELMEKSNEIQEKKIAVLTSCVESLGSLLTLLVVEKEKQLTKPVPTAIIPPTTPIVAQPIIPTPPLPSSAPTPAKPVTNDEISRIKSMFPEDIEAMLTFVDDGTFIKMKPRQYLGSDCFAKVASIVRGIGGEYVSAGKDSHFRFRKKNP
jgi:hypothetical protein